MTFQPPGADMVATMRFAAGFDALAGTSVYQDLSADDLGTVLGEAGRFASEVIAPLNVVGDREGARRSSEGVVTTPGWREAYRAVAKALQRPLPNGTLTIGTRGERRD